jgi:hypothetical protein
LEPGRHLSNEKETVMTEKAELYFLFPEGEPSQEERRFDSLLVSLDRLRSGPPITENVRRMAREEFARGLITELINGPSKEMRTAIKQSGSLHLLFKMLLDVTPEVLSNTEYAQIDLNLTNITTFDWDSSR